MGRLAVVARRRRARGIPEEAAQMPVIKATGTVIVITLVPA